MDGIGRVGIQGLPSDISFASVLVSDTPQRRQPNAPPREMVNDSIEDHVDRGWRLFITQTLRGAWSWLRTRLRGSDCVHFGNELPNSVRYLKEIQRQIQADNISDVIILSTLQTILNIKQLYDTDLFEQVTAEALGKLSNQCFEKLNDALASLNGQNERESPSSTFIIHYMSKDFEVQSAVKMALKKFIIHEHQALRRSKASGILESELVVVQREESDD